MCLTIKKGATMGAIIRLRKMPSKCSECPFADEEIKRCAVKPGLIIAGKTRNCRMPLCPLQNEGEYLTAHKKLIEGCSGWIPVEERLPEEDKEVLVWYEYFRHGNYDCMYQTFGIGYQFDGQWGGDVNGYKARCIAWMPLPEPYRVKIGELDERCENCKIRDFCTESYGSPQLCVYEELEGVEQEEYKRIAESVTEEEIEDKLRQYEGNDVRWTDIRNGAIYDIVLEKIFKQGGLNE